MTWTQPCCEACWVRRHLMAEGETMSLKLPTRVVADAAVEQCCFCGAITCVGIYVRHDPQRVAYPREDPDLDPDTT